MSWSPLMWLNSFVTLDPNNHPAPLLITFYVLFPKLYTKCIFKNDDYRLDMTQVSIWSGSDHTRSAYGPSWGISMWRSMVRIWSIVLISGDNPPWTHKTSPSIMAPKNQFFHSENSKKFHLKLITNWKNVKDFNEIHPRIWVSVLSDNFI